MQLADAVFEGGGVKGIGLIGGLAAFEEAGFQWQNVAGSSAGAITAALMAVGYRAAEMRRIMNEEVVFRQFMDRAGVGRVPLIGPYLSLLRDKGMYQGDYFLQLMRGLLSRKVGKERVTFGDLVTEKQAADSEADYQTRYKYRLRVVASDLSTNTMLHLPQDIASLGIAPSELEVALAVRMSMSLPFFFKPVAQREASPPRAKHWIVDGGLLSNFPIDIFDAPPGQVPQWPTIGFLLWEPGAQQRPRQIGGPISLAIAILGTMAQAHDRKAIEQADANRIVKIPTGKYQTTDFDLTAADRDWLYDSGYRAATQFLTTWDLAGYQAARQHRQGPGAPPPSSASAGPSSWRPP